MIQLYPYLIIALKSISIYVFIIVAIRLFGKKEMSQLSIIDLVFILLISNSVQNGMVGALGLFLCNYVFRFFLMKSPKFNKVMQGEEIVLVLNGKLLQEGLKRAVMSEEELEMTIREHGIKDVKEADLVVLEIDGNVSVISSNFSKKSIKRRKRPQLMRNS